MARLIEHRVTATGKSAYVGATRVRVSDIARMSESLQTELMVDRIREAIPSLSEAEIVAALRYWDTHRGEITQEIQRDEDALSSLDSAV